MTFADNLRHTIEARFLKTSKFRAKLVRAGLIVAPNTIRNWRLGKTAPNIAQAAVIAQVLETSLDALCGLDGKGEPKAATRTREMQPRAGSGLGYPF